MEGYFSKWIKLQEQGLSDIKESFSEVPKFYVELQDSELRTLEVLRRIGGEIYESSDPDEVLFRKEIYISDKEERTLKIYLPFARKDELELEQVGTELLVGVRNERRRFPIPTEFEEYAVAGARFEDGYLCISFS